MPRTLVRHVMRGASSRPLDAWKCPPGVAAQRRGVAPNYSEVEEAELQPTMKFVRYYGGIAVSSSVAWAVFMLVSSGDRHSQHLVDAFSYVTLCHILFASVLFLTRKHFSSTAVLIFTITWMIAITFVTELAMRCGTSASACLIVVPVLAGVGGGRFTTLATFVALASQAVIAWLETNIDHDPLDFSVGQVLVTNASIELFASTLAVGLFSHLLKLIERMERDSIEWGLMLARDIRTPMHGLLGLLDGLKDVELGNTDTETVHTLSGCSQMMLAIVDTMLGSPKFGVQSREQTVLVSDLMEVKHIAQAMAWQKAQSVSVKLRSRGQPCQAVRLFFSDFLQVLGNLLSNAVKFSPAGSPITIWLTIERLDGRDDCALTVEIADCGPGVPPHMREKIFKPFERGTLKDPVEGVGLGLSIVAETVSAMGGTVECRDPGDSGGASFVVHFAHLPLATPLDGPPNQILRKYFCHGSKSAVGRILVVDDNALNLHLLRTFLQSSGVQNNDIITTTSGESALDIMSSEVLPFGAAILDMVLPGIDGIELASRLSAEHRQRFPDAPHIVLLGASSSLTPSVHESWNRVGVVCQFTKPFQRSAVTEMLEFIQSRRQASVRLLSPVESPSDSARNFQQRILGRTSVEPRVQLLAGLVAFVPVFALARFIPCVVAGVCSKDPKGELVFRMAVALAAIFMRLVVYKFPTTVRTLTMCMFYIGMVIKMTYLGCGSFVGYAFVPIFAGLVYDSRAIAKNFAICVAIHWSVIACKYMQIAPNWVYSGVVASTRSQQQIDIATVIVAVAGCILVYLSLMTLLQELRARWTNTLSHDLRAPLHGMFASISDLEENDRLPHSASCAIRTMKTCANTLLAVTDTVLAMAVTRTPTPSMVRMDVLCAELDSAVAMVLDSELIDRIENTAASDAAVVCDRSALTYALTQMATAVPLLSRSHVKICFHVKIDHNARTVVICAEEAARPPSFAAAERDPSRLGDSAASVWGVHVGQSTLVRVVEGILHGTVRLVVDDTSAWRLTVNVPVVVTTALAEPEKHIEPSRKGVRIVVIDDSMLNLRISKRMLSRYGIEPGFLTMFQSSVEAVSALESGLMDNADVMLVDLNMPQVSGFEFSRLARERFAQLPSMKSPILVACTGDVNPETQAAALLAGMQQVLIKPFDRKQLTKVISQALELKLL